jgi:hypothetical protein
MKKLLFVAVFAMTVLVANAQVRWDVRVGANVSGIENSDAKMKLGLKAGVGVEFALSEAFSFRPMLFYSSKGVTEGKSNLGFFPDKTLALNYIELPVLVSYRFRITDGFSLAANAGPYVACLVGKKNTGDVKYNNFDTGVNAGLDFVFNRFLVGVEAEYGFSSLASNVDKLHNINYSLMVGYKF